MKIELIHKNFSLTGELNTSTTSKKIIEILPVEGTAVTWGSEVYFDIPVKTEEEPDAKKVLSAGDIAFWPPGNAFCIFFGPTPISSGKNPEAYSNVNVIGKVTGDIDLFRKVMQGDLLKVVQSKTQ